MEQKECSEMSAHRIQMPGSYPEESIQNAEHGKSFEIKNFLLLDGISPRRSHSPGKEIAGISFSLLHCVSSDLCDMHASTI